MMTTESTADENRVPQADRTVAVPCEKLFFEKNKKTTEYHIVAVPMDYLFVWENHLRAIFLVITLTLGGLAMCKHD